MVQRKSFFFFFFFEIMCFIENLKVHVAKTFLCNTVTFGAVLQYYGYVYVNMRFSPLFVIK